MCRLLIVGLDGATFDIIRPMVGQGRLPNLARLMSTGSWGEIRSTIPPRSEPAWSAFMTGQNPGQTGSFDFRTYDPTRYTFLDERIVTADVLSGRTFWDVLGDHGYRVGIITVPVTYPSWEVNGLMLSGFPCPDGALNYTYPEEWAEELTERYNFPVGHFQKSYSEDAIIEDGYKMMERRTTLAARLLREENLDVLVLVFGAIDRAQHEFWKYLDPAFPSYHSERRCRYEGAIACHYEKADESVGRLLECAGEDPLVFIMSDHGAGPHPLRFFHTNCWLRQMGYLKLKRQRDPLQTLLKKGISLVKRMVPNRDMLRRLAPERMVERVRTVTLNIGNVDWPTTVAYRFAMYGPAEGIEINLKGRQEQGIVAPGSEYEALRDEIIRELRDIRDPDTGEAVAERVYPREEIYSGRYLNRAPDIVLVLGDGYKAGRALVPPIVSPVPLAQAEVVSGQHRFNGVFIARGPSIRQGGTVEGLELTDIAPTVLHALGVPVPDDMDGRVATEVFDPEWMSKHEIVSFSRQFTKEVPALELPALELPLEEEEEMKRKLKGLGYF